MTNFRSNPLRVHVWGDMGCFTRPELKVERLSYDVMTPSAARGVLESILWKPAIVWRVSRIEVLTPIQWISFRRNEVKDKGSLTSMKGIDIEKSRTQRMTCALRNVDYIIEAYFELTDKTGERDNVTKFEEMFRRRVEHGQRYQQPYFGCREFPALFDADTNGKTPIPETRQLGPMFYDFLYSREAPEVPKTGKSRRKNAPTPRVEGKLVCTPLSFRAELIDGVLHVPPLSDVIEYNR